MKFAGARLFPLAVTALAAVLVFAWSLYSQRFATTPLPKTETEQPERPRVYLGPINSLAVLQFTYGQAVPGQEFWAPGFSRELHRLIQQATGIQLTSLSSSFYFNLHPAPPDLIAERLQVRHILSGEFEKTDGRLRVTAQLYDAKRKSIAWSETYERDLEQVFSIEDEILDALANVIRPRKSDSLPRAETVDIEAWKLYLMGLYFSDSALPGRIVEARQSFLSALEIAPDFGQARVGLARLSLQQYVSQSGQPDWVEEARTELEAALESASAAPEALGLLSYIRHSVDWDWLGALEAAEQAVQLRPGDPELMNRASLALFSLGQFPEARDLLVQAVAQNPLNLVWRLRLGLLHEFAGEYQEALKNYRQIITLNPEFPGVRAYLARIRIIQDGAESALEESEMEVDPFWRRYAHALALTALDRDDEAQSYLEEMITFDAGHSAYQVTEILAFQGKTGLAFDWFDRAFEQHDGGMGELIGNYFLRNLHADPRWTEMLVRMGLPPGENPEPR